MGENMFSSHGNRRKENIKRYATILSSNNIMFLPFLRKWGKKTRLLPYSYFGELIENNVKKKVMKK